MKTNLTTQEIYTLLTGRLSMTLNRSLLQEFKAQGIPLTREQWSILAVLWQEDGCSQQTIATKTHRDKPSVTRLLDKMQKEGLIVRKPHPTDRRLNLIYITPKAKSYETQAYNSVNHLESIATKGLSTEQIEQLKNTVRTIMHNLENQEV